MSATLPDFLQAMLLACPSAGSGVHTWLYSVARQLHAHYPAGQIVSMLEERTRTCGRHVPQREIVAAVQDALETAWQPTGKNCNIITVAPKWPAVNAEQVEAIVKDGPALADLWELSPVRFEDNAPHSDEIIDALFPGNPLLCCGESAMVFDTKEREAWRGELHRQQLIVPSAMSAATGLTKDGRESKHCLSNTGPRQYLVVEFDQGTFDQHAALLWNLAGYGPLVMAVHSGSKSLHGWFKASGVTEDKLLKFFRYSVTIGADPATWTRSQFVRMPFGTRDNGKRQAVYYFNPQLTKEDK